VIRRSRIFGLSGAARQGSSARQRVLEAGVRLRDGLLRDNKVLPAVLAVLAVLILAWVVADTVWNAGGDGANEEQAIREQANVAQVPDDGENAAPEDPQTPAPGTENRDAESFAVFETKDPFRELLQTAESDDDAGDGTGDGTGTGDADGTDDTTGDPATTDSDGDGTTDDLDAAPTDPNVGGTGGAGGGTGDDLDADGIPDADENDGDLDDDGISDADDLDTRDSDGDGTADSQDSTPNGTGAGDDQYDSADPDAVPPPVDDGTGDGDDAYDDGSDAQDGGDGSGGLFDSGGLLPRPVP